MNLSYLKKGDVVKFNIDGLSWLIIEIANDHCLLIMLNTLKTKFLVYSYSAVDHMIDAGEVEIISYDASKDNVIPFPTTAAAKKIDERIRMIAEDILKRESTLLWLIDSHKRAKFFKEESEKYDTSTDTVRRFLRDYLQHNMSLRFVGSKYFKCGGKGKMKNFISNKRAGRKGISQVVRNQAVIKQFDVALERYIKAKTRIKMPMLYEDLCQMFYSTQKVVNGEICSVPYPQALRPTKRQMEYHVRTHITDANKYIAQRGPVDARNNIRPLHSDTIADLKGASIGGRYEMDEMETDFYLVSRDDRNQPISRAIFYAIIDVQSKLVTGFSVTLDNNAWNGAKIALLNMVEDKVELCQRAGINIKEEQWPASGVLPKEIEVDNGAEYLSKNFEKFALENGIQLAFVPARTGSYKPNVEQLFHQFNSYIYERLPGQIVKEQYGNEHIRKANLTIEEFYQIVLNFIITYNNNVKTTYTGDAETFRSKIMLTPANVWNLKVKKQNSLKKVLDMDSYKYSLLDKGKASITREGIVFSKVIYTCEELKWLESEMMDVSFNGRKSLDIRYDSRNMDVIYFELNNRIVKGWINERKTSNGFYIGLSYSEVLFINKQIKEMETEGREYRLEQKIAFNERIDAIVKESKKKHKGKNTTKNIRESRATEKKRLHNETQIVIGNEPQKPMIEGGNPELERKGKGKAPSLIRLEKEQAERKLSFYEIEKLQREIKYEIEVQGYDPE